MEKDKVLQEFLSAVKMRTDGANPLEKIMVSLKDHFPPLSDQRLPTSSSSDIDCVVSDLQRLVTAMKIHRNTLIPIHHLPDDVLSLIVRAYCLGDDDNSIYSIQRWAKIMFVCRRWFNLITEDSFLWSFIDVNGDRRCIPRIRMQLKRSNDHLLFIRHEDSTAPLAVYSLLSNEAHRVGCLRLSGSADTITAIWNNFLGSNLPPLHSLSIQAYGTAELALPESFLAIPSLRHLTLEDTSFPVALLPRNLVDLDLSASSLDFQNIDIWVFLGLVSQMTLLRKLRVVNFVDARSGSTLAEAPLRVLLPELLELSIGNSLQAIAGFLFVLQLPASCVLQILCNSVIHHSTLFPRSICPRMREMRRQPGTKPIRLLRMYTSFYPDLPWDLEISGFTHTEVKRLPPIYARHGIDFAFGFLFHRGKYRNRICRRLFRVIAKDAVVLDMQQITTQIHQLTEGWWKVALLCLPALEEVRLAADFMTMVNFCNALSRLCTTHPRSFPRLKAIHVAKVPKHLLHQRANSPGINDVTLSERSFERCLLLVKRLKTFGFPLSLLTVDLVYHEWPGTKQARELAQFVDCFMYNETTVYDYDALKASHVAWQANMLEAMREIHGPDFEWPPDEEFDGDEQVDS